MVLVCSHPAVLKLHSGVFTASSSSVNQQLDCENAGSGSSSAAHKQEAGSPVRRRGKPHLRPMLAQAPSKPDGGAGRPRQDQVASRPPAPCCSPATGGFGLTR